MNEIHVTLTVEELNVVMAGLGKLPLETCINVWGKIRSQAEQQLNQPPVESKQNE